MVATTLYGLEDELARELDLLGAQNIVILNRAVKFYGDQFLMYRCNMFLRTAIKVLKPIAVFDVHNENALYRKIITMPWGDYLTVNQTFAIDGATSGEVFTHSKFVALKCKDAIADQFREECGERPSVDTENPDLRINIHIADVTCTVSLDSSGVSLGKRGYRTRQTLAPLSEVLAAGMIYLAGWHGHRDFIDPMCGSGTIPIEAAMIAANIAPGKLRHFGFENWNDFEPDLFEQVKKEAADAERIPDCKIYGSDMDSKAVEIAVENAERAGVAQWVTLKQQDILMSESPSDEALVLINPPYGERLSDEEAVLTLYGEMGTRLKHFYNGCDAWIISSNMRALKLVGLRPSRKIKIYNGQLECKLNKFELYRGTRRYGRQEEEK